MSKKKPFWVSRSGLWHEYNAIVLSTNKPKVQRYKNKIDYDYKEPFDVISVNNYFEYFGWCPEPGECVEMESVW